VEKKRILSNSSVHARVDLRFFRKFFIVIHQLLIVTPHFIIF
jgi:hypothetical protein